MARITKTEKRTSIKKAKDSKDYEDMLIEMLSETFKDVDQDKGNTNG